jgi:hypothetical protein
MATRGSLGLLKESARGEPNQGRSEKDRRERCVCCPLILLKNSDFRINHDLEDRWQR